MANVLNPPHTPLISLRQITKTYELGTVVSQVLKNVSLTIRAGELLAIMGASGSGKSTLMNIIGLLDSTYEGDYRLHDQCVMGLNDAALAQVRNQRMGFIFQQFNLLPRFTAAQNIALPLLYRQCPPAHIAARVNAALARVGMQAYADHRPTQLSGGQQQRVAIARALVGEPQVILADEPTGALDSRTGHEIMQLFLSLHNEGCTILLVTHDEQVAKQCHRCITLSDGQLISDQQR